MILRILLRKDLARELRGKEGIAAGLVLVALFLVLDLWTFPSLADAPRAATAALWTPVVFAAAAVAGRGMAAEVDRGTIEWLRSLPVGLGLHGLSRTIVDTALLVLLAMTTLLLVTLLFALPGAAPIAVVLLLGAVGLGVVGSLAGALAAQATAREVLLPILIVPVVAPLLLSGVNATIGLLAGATLADMTAPLLVMAGFDLIASGVAAFLWPVALESD